VPHFLDVEVAHVIRRHAAAGVIGANRGRTARGPGRTSAPALSARLAAAARMGAEAHSHRLQCRLRRPGRGARCAARHARCTPCCRARTPGQDRGDVTIGAPAAGCGWGGLRVAAPRWTS
jgi:hypothetical protein